MSQLAGLGWAGLSGNGHGHGDVRRAARQLNSARTSEHDRTQADKIRVNGHQMGQWCPSPETLTVARQGLLLVPIDGPGNGDHGGEKGNGRQSRNRWR